jgi:F0F1-type ATP synthase assembly protein I
MIISNIALGVVLGAVIGVVLGNVGLGMGIGIAIGLLFATDRHRRTGGRTARNRRHVRCRT